MSDERTPEVPASIARPSLELLDGGRLDAVNASDRVTLSQLALDPTHADSISTKVTVTASAGRPSPTAYFRVHPNPGFAMALCGLKAADGLYLATNTVREAIPAELTYLQVVTTITRAGALGVWPISMPRPGAQMMNWTRSALEAANLAMKQWVRIRSNTSIGAYEVHRLVVSIPEPEWPDLTFEEILTIAFEKRIIDSVDHPLVRELRGLA
jgi:hypothetical protein